MDSYPRWVADDQVEAAGCRDVGEMRTEGEGKGRAVAERLDFVPYVSQATTNAFESDTCLMIGCVPESKQVLGAQQHQQLLALGAETNSSTRKNVDCRRPFELVERASQSQLAGAGGSHVSAAKAGQLATAGAAAAIVECAAGEGISDADVPVEIRERRNAHWIGLVALDHNRQ